MISSKLHFLLVIVLLCYSCTNTTKTENTIVEEKDSISLTDAQKLELAAEGNQVGKATLTTRDSTFIETDSFRGKLLVVDFWATWCSGCVIDAPYFKEIAEKYENENVAFISISIDSDFSTWKKFLIENDWKGNHFWHGRYKNDDFSYLLYSKPPFESKWDVAIALPKYVIISPSGKILSNVYMRPREPEFEIKIKKYLNL
ncbi:TlpA family protein disulfide reductase [Aquimarina litoralis]|uniref:TlpA family protein disulfide reductase n=1 Tax=Aquimarina litoralis TaxID=584605 RepID=UPI001C55CEC2|nr:TlpA disulfide reductase family protein [Aquimarina litoralis]